MRTRPVSSACLCLASDKIDLSLSIAGVAPRANAEYHDNASAPLCSADVPTGDTSSTGVNASNAVA